jgi:hypothetical protein
MAPADSMVKRFMTRRKPKPKNWVQYSDGYIGPNDAATRARHPLGGTRPFGPQTPRKKKARGATGYNKGRLPG